MFVCVCAYKDVTNLQPQISSALSATRAAILFKSACEYGRTSSDSSTKLIRIQMKLINPRKSKII